MNKKRLLAMLVSICLLAVIGIGSTFAYFTASEDEVNVVTMGHVAISLFENVVTQNENGDYVRSDEESPVTKEGLSFVDVLPGDVIPKNPTVLVETDSKRAYIRVLVTTKADSYEEGGLTESDISSLRQSIMDDIVLDENWSYNTSDGYYYYAYPLNPGESATLFDTITIPIEWENNVAGQKFYILIQAEAIQADYLKDGITSEAGGKITAWSLLPTDIQTYTTVSP